MKFKRTVHRKTILRTTHTARNTALIFGALLVALGVVAYVVPEAHAYTSNAFVMVVKTDNPGTSNSTSFTIPITGTGYSYNVDCDDNGVNEVTARTTSYTCVYGAAGTYTVAITGTFPRIYFNNGGDRQKLLEVKQWGTGAWTSMANAFYGCNNLHVTATDAPNLAGVTSLAAMFRGATSFNESINHWNTTNITSLSQTFYGTTTFNQPLDNWNTANVTTLSETFYGASTFNQPLNSWNTVKVTSLYRTFRGATAFNQPLTSWNTAVVTTMSETFYSASAFNSDISTWNTGMVTNMGGMFDGATIFNQPINSWNTAAVTNMSGMFRKAANFNQPIGSWNTGLVTNMSGMFDGGSMWGGASVFNQDISSWDTANVTTMANMFQAAASFNQPIGSWDTGSVTTMNYMFASASAFNQPIGAWDTSAVTGMNRVFWYASQFNQPLNSWNTINVINMDSMFAGASAFNQPLNDWNVSRVTNMFQLFASATSFNGNIGAWNTGNVTNMYRMFSNSAFNQDISAWDVSNVQLMGEMFSYLKNFNQPLTNWNTSGVTDMSSMFQIATTFNQPLNSWDIGAVTNMDRILNYSGYTTTTYDQTLAGWASQSVQPNVPLGALGVSYCNDTARAVLTSAPNNWVITDGGYCPPTITSPTSLDVVSTATPTITGAVAPNRTVHVTIDGADFTTTSQGDGSFSYLVTSPLANGWHTLAVRSTDVSDAPGVPRTLNFYVHTGGSINFGGSVLKPTLSWNAAPGTATGTIWSQTVQGASSFPARGGFGVASFNGKLWAVGGQGVSGRYRDVWSSPDGITWTQEVANAPWSARNSHSLTAFNGKLWLMGGYVGGSSAYKNDIWSSPDGITWTQEVANAPWPVRSGHRVVEHNGLLWLMGGVYSIDGLQDVWNSTDGVNWTLVTNTAAWSVRNGFGAASFNGKLWVMGGANGGSNPFTNDVWSSTDGITWTEETSSAAWPVRASHQVEVFDNKLWVLGGSAADWDSEYSDVWYSENGRDWFRTVEAADWPARRGHSSAVFNDKLWVLGGRVGQFWTLSNDVWSAGLPDATYTVCWDTVSGGCTHSAQTTNLSFTLPDELSKGTWYFTVTATVPPNINVGTYTTTSYQITDPAPVVVPFASKPVTNPLTGQPSATQLPSAISNASLSVSSYHCSDVQQSTMSLFDPSGLKTPDTNISLLGGFGFSLACAQSGKSADVALTLGTTYGDTTKLRAYKGNGSSLQDITDQVTFRNQTIDGVTKTVLSYALADGGSLDEDMTANGTIVDPIYIGIVTAPGAPDTGRQLLRQTSVLVPVGLAVTTLVFGVMAARKWSEQ